MSISEQQELRCRWTAFIQLAVLNVSPLLTRGLGQSGSKMKSGPKRLSMSVAQTLSMYLTLSSIAISEWIENCGWLFEVRFGAVRLMRFWYIASP